MDVLQLPFLALILDIIGFREIGAKVMTGARLQGFSVLHHSFHRVGSPGAGKFFLIALLADIHRQGQHILGHLPVNLQHLQRLFLRLFCGRMDGMTLLPQELAGPQERPGCFFPPHNGAPLIIHHGQVPPGLNPLGIHRTENCLARGPNRQPFLQLLAAPLGDPGHLRGKAFHMLCLLQKQAFRNQHGEINVLRTGLLETGIHLCLDPLPDGIAIGPDNHASPHRCVITEFCLLDHVRIPLGKILAPGSNVGHKFLLVLRHSLVLRPYLLELVLFLDSPSSGGNASNSLFIAADPGNTPYPLLPAMPVHPMLHRKRQ